MHPSNVVVLQGRISGDPTVRELPSGRTVTQVEVTTTCDDAAVTVPVVVESAPVTVRAGDVVVVVGHVRRRFFRAGGVTQSRTEVVAAEISRSGRHRTVERLIGRAVAALDASRGGL